MSAQDQSEYCSEPADSIEPEDTIGKVAWQKLRSRPRLLHGARPGRGEAWLDLAFQDHALAGRVLLRPAGAAGTVQPGGHDHCLASMTRSRNGLSTRPDLSSTVDYRGTTRKQKILSRLSAGGCL